MCCLTANINPIHYIPPPIGNVINLGQIVLSLVDGVTYFIDVAGRSLALATPRPIFYGIDLPDGVTDYIVVPNWCPLPDPDDYPNPTYHTDAEIAKRLHVKRNDNWVTWNLHFTLSFVGDEQRVYFTPTLNADHVEFHVRHHPSIPYEGYTQDQGS